MSRPGEGCGIWQLFVEQGRTPVLCDLPRVPGCDHFHKAVQAIPDWLTLPAAHRSWILDLVMQLQGARGSDSWLEMAGATPRV